MRYQGGKFYLAKYYLPFLLRLAADCTTYVEPFVGSASVAERLVAAGLNLPLVLSDLSLDLILLYTEMQAGRFSPPATVTEEEYRLLKEAEPSAIRGFVGYGASWGGKFFGGYGRDFRPGQDIVRASARAITRTSSILKDAQFVCGTYKDLEIPARSLVYCDPPYEGRKYYFSTGFDSKEFWDKAGQWVDKGHIVVVSELKAPLDWSLLWSSPKTVNIRWPLDRTGITHIEGLFIHNSQLSLT